MTKSIYALLLSCFLASGAFAQLPHLVFHAELVGSEQIPSVDTDARGLITLMYSPDRTKVTVTGLLVGLEGDVDYLTLYIGKAGEVGSPILDLTAVLNGPRLQGEVDVPPALLQNLLPDRVYASLGTTAHPDGEIRGQFICETDLEYGAMMQGSEVVPASNSTAFGFGGIHFPTGSTEIVYAFLVDGLSSPITEAGIYFGEPGVNGTLVHEFPDIFQNIIQDVAYLDDLLLSDFLSDAREGKYYVEIKTENYPAGEIRGQVNFLGYFSSLAPINRFQVVPASPASDGFGFSHNVLNTTLDSLTTTAYISTISPNSVDVMIGAAGENGVWMESLEPTGSPGLYRKTYPLDFDRMTTLVEGKLYINVPTNEEPDGELRGQLKTSLRKAYAFDLCGEQVVPPVSTNGVGVGMASVDQVNCYMNYKIIYDRMSSNLSGVNVSLGEFGMNGLTLYSLPHEEILFTDGLEIAAGQGEAIEMEKMNFLLRTTDHPSGEIRGQIRRGYSCPDVTSIDQIAQIQDIVVSPVPFTDQLTVRFSSQNSFKGRLILFDLLGAPVLVKNVDVIQGEQSLSVATDGLIPGVYTLNLEMPEKKRSVLLKRLVKQ